MIMEIIRNVNELYINMLGMNPVKLDAKYRWSKLIVSLDIDDGKVLFSGLSRAIVFLHNSELDNLYDIKTYEFLYRMYFLVPEDYNEIEAVNMLRDKLRIPVDDLYLNFINRYTILPTLACNARCEYCYESKLKHKRNMTSATALKVAEFILRKSTHTDTVRLSWFGGEPLVNYKAIDLIVNQLKNNGKRVESEIITNGYLIDDKMMKKFVENWGIYSVQITLDGVGEVYNRIKNYVNVKENAYQRIVNNIKMLLSAGIIVNIRLNVTLENGDALLEVVEDMNAIFGARSGLRIYCRAIFEEGKPRTEEENKPIYDSILKIESKLKEYEFSIGQNCDENMTIVQCMADDGRSVLIDPEGNLGTCEHHVADDFYGNVGNSDIDFDILNGWRDYGQDKDICKDCPVYTECLRPNKCIELRNCDRVVRDYRIHQYKEGLERLYLDYRMNNMIPSALML